MNLSQTLIFVLIISSFSTFSLAQSNQKIIYAGKMLDVTKATIQESVQLTIENEIIVKIDFDAQKPDTAFIDLSDYTILPGLIDCHTHLTANWYLGDNEFDEYALPAPAYGIIGTVNAKITLEAGFTTVRDLHGEYYGDVALRDAINKGWVPGPRMYVSGPGLSITGGHGAWGNWLSPALAFKGNPGSVADGVVEVQKETRKHLKYQVDWIKVFATGGFGSYGTKPGAASYTIEEMKAAVKEASKLGIPVAAHAHGAEGIKNAIEAGVKSIEHGTYLDDELITLMKEKSVFLSMDLKSAYFDLIESNVSYEDKLEGKSESEGYRDLEMTFKNAYDSGVKIVFATDAGVYPHGENAKQFSLMKKAGMPNKEIIKTATINAAELLDLSDKLGSLEVGKWADIIAIKGNPLEDISLLEKVYFVMKDGEVYKSID